MRTCAARGGAALLVAAVKSGHFAEVVEQYLQGRMQARKTCTGGYATC